MRGRKSKVKVGARQCHLELNPSGSRMSCLLEFMGTMIKMTAARARM